MRLRGQLAITLIPMVVLPVFMIGWMASDYLVDSRRQAIHNEMDTLLQQIEANTRTHMAAIRANTESVSRSNLVTSYVAVEEEETRYTVFQSPLLRLFADYAQVYPEYYEFRILLPDGTEDARYAAEMTANATEAEGETPHFMRAKESADPFHAELTVNPDNNQPALLVTRRLTVQTATRIGLGKPPLQAYLAVAIRPDFLTAPIQPLHIGQRGFAFFADADGRILIGPAWRSLPERLSPNERKALTFLAVQGKFDHFHWMNDRFLVKGRLLGNGLSLYTMLDEGELTAGMDILHLQVAGGVLVAILLLFPLLYWVLQQQFVRPLLYLSQASQEVGRGHFAIAGLDAPAPLSGGARHNELGRLMEAFHRMVADLDRLHTESRLYTVQLEEKVAERTMELHAKNQALHQSLQVIAEANGKIQDSIQYAQRIQQALLPDWGLVQSHLPDSFILWEPRDVVGGDIYFADVVDGILILALLDCTGHGVPGAFMTMIAVSALRRIVRDEGVRSPAELLQSLNFIVKTTLHQDTEQAQSNDGMDAGILAIDRSNRQILYAGARISLITLRGETVQVIPGEKKSLGYKDSPLRPVFQTHCLPAEPGSMYYLATDGLTDQLGGPKGISLGTRRLHALLAANSALPMDVQKILLQEQFRAYQGEWERLDDVAALGFRV